MGFNINTGIPLPRRMQLAADRVTQYLRGAGFRVFMQGRAVDLVKLQRALIDSKKLKPLSKARQEQRTRHHVPFGPDHPLKATGQLYDSLKGEAQTLADGRIAAVVYARKTKRTPEERVGDKAAAAGLDAEGAFLESQFRAQRSKRRRRLRRRAGESGGRRSAGASNPELVRIHRDTGRDITGIPQSFIADAHRRFADELRAVVRSTPTAGRFARRR